MKRTEARMMPAVPEPGKESRERREAERVPLEMSVDSKASPKHPDRNEDASLGDTERLTRELTDVPRLHTADVDADNKKMEHALVQEIQASDKLKERAVFGVLDGVSGAGNNGSGTLASRIASGRIAEFMQHMPTDADAERSRRQIEMALTRAHETVVEHKYGMPFEEVAKLEKQIKAAGGNPSEELPKYAKRPDLIEMATTADIIRTIDNGDGTIDVAYGHSGDSRIYVLDGETGELRSETIDDGFAGNELREGRITRKQYDQVMSAPGIDALPDDLKMLYRYRNMVMPDRVVGAQPDYKPTTGTFRVKKGDKILLSSDGIHDNLTNDKIRDILMNGGGVNGLVEAAAKFAATDKKRGKEDDTTAQLIEFGEPDREKTVMMSKEEVEQQRQQRDARRAESHQRDAGRMQQAQGELRAAYGDERAKRVEMPAVNPEPQKKESLGSRMAKGLRSLFGGK